MRQKIIASELLLESVRRHQIHLSLLVADTGLWVSPVFYGRLVRDTGSPAVFPRVRRARTGHGEKRGQILEGIRFDDNSYANVAIKRAIGLGGGQAEGFEACHIWPLTCYDERYHTAVGNIVLLPRALAGLSDHDRETQESLQYRAFELYGWSPDGLPQPSKPDFYPSEWREPQPDPADSGTPRSAAPLLGTGPGGDEMSEEKHRVLTDRIREWSSRPELNVHKIIALVAQSETGVPRDQLVQRVADVTQSRNPYGAVASLLTDSGNAYGRVFEEAGGLVRLHPEVAMEVDSHRWSVG